MISLRDVVTGFGVRDPLAEVWRRDLRGGGGGSAEITGVPPLRYIGYGRPLTDYRIAGNTIQNGTPSPDAPVDVIGCGVRTGNLAKFWRTAYVNKNTAGTLIEQSNNGMTYPVKLLAGQTITFSDRLKNYSRGFAVFREFDGTTLSGLILRQLTTYTYTASENCYVVVWCNYDNSTNITNANFGLCKTMLNLGSTALPYEPYGYKLPLTVNGTEHPIYLWQVETTRRIKKYEFTGREIIVTDLTHSRFFFTLNDSLIIGVRKTPAFCTHLQVIDDGRAIANVPNNALYSDSGNSRWFIKTTDYTTADDFKSYLAQQYANGTPITVWYVLAEPETAIVNEPLMKIGDYADTISFAQSGVAIPTVNGENVLDVPTEVPPSEITIKGGISSV